MRKNASILGLVVAGLMLLSRPGAAAEATSVEALKDEVARKGWIICSISERELKGTFIPDSQWKSKGQYDLFVMRPDGSGLRNITQTPDRSEFFVRLAPDRKRMLYQSVPAGAKVEHASAGTLGDLVIARVDGSRTTVLGPATQYAWASFNPRMTHFACLDKAAGKIRFMDAGTRRVVREMSNHGIFQQLYWSPDGRRVLGTANVDGLGRWNIISVDIRTEEVKRLTRLINCTPDWFKQDSRRVIYSHRNPRFGKRTLNRRTRVLEKPYGTTMLMQATADGGKRSLVCADYEHHLYGAVLSPDDTYVLFNTTTEHDTRWGPHPFELHIMRLADAPIVRPGFDRLRRLFPTANAGPVYRITRPDGSPLVISFEAEWTYEELGQLTGSNRVSPEVRRPQDQP